ncbi:MAG: branched-chain amino acid ABC transporter permease [Desulfobacteraceae bacterium]|nr:MAG: branched-chain amino acid ABC transporter permease [Desulfobacteraceae bacterium]
MFINLLLNGIVTGSIYTLISLGFIFAYRSTGAFNFFHGELYMLGAFSGYILHSEIGLPLILCLPLAILVTCFAGIAVERIAIRPLVLAPHYHIIIATAALGLAIRNLVLVETKGNTKLFPPYLPSSGPTIFDVRLHYQKILIIAVTLMLVVLLQIFFKRTKAGKAMRALVSNQKAALLMGINVSSMQMVTFGLASALGGIAGILAAPLFVVDAYMGLFMTFKIFCVAVLGGLTSTTGPIVAGYLLGIMENLVAGYLSSEYGDILSFLIIILILVFRPSGIMGKKISQKI